MCLFIFTLIIIVLMYLFFYAYNLFCVIITIKIICFGLCFYIFFIVGLMEDCLRIMVVRRWFDGLFIGISRRIIIVIVFGVIFIVFFVRIYMDFYLFLRIFRRQIDRVLTRFFVLLWRFWLFAVLFIWQVLVYVCRRFLLLFL